MILIQIYILFCHWLGDFIGQTREMANNKSSSNKWLTKHVISYGNFLLIGSLPLLVFGLIVGKNWALPILIYVLVNMVLHWVTDYFTSRLAKKLYYEKGDEKGFWVVIGFDQFIHASCLLLTYDWLIS